MNQIDTGKFIADCRKEKGLTQARLAEMLNITDRAVSKWETGKCMPDSSIMPALCRILDISVDELLSGKRAETEDHGEKVRRNLTESKRKNKSRVIPTVYTAALGIGILVCCLCDIAVSGTLGWSLTVLSSVFFAWIVSFPMLLLRKSGIVISLISVSIFTVPFLYILRILLNVGEIFRIGKVMSVIALVFLWTVFALYHRLKKRKLLSAGIAFLLAIPFTVLINIALSKMLGEPVMDIWDILSVFILLTVAVAFLIGDYKSRKTRLRNTGETAYDR